MSLAVLVYICSLKYTRNQKLMFYLSCLKMTEITESFCFDARNGLQCCLCHSCLPSYCKHQCRAGLDGCANQWRLVLEDIPSQKWTSQRQYDGCTYVSMQASAKSAFAHWSRGSGTHVSVGHWTKPDLHRGDEACKDGTYVSIRHRAKSLDIALTCMNLLVGQDRQKWGLQWWHICQHGG